MFGSDIVVRRGGGKRSYGSAFGNFRQAGPPAKRFRPATRESVRRSFRNYQRRQRNARIGGYLGIEHKFYDSSAALVAIGAQANMTNGLKNPSATITLNTVAQGDGEQNRDGRQIMMKSVHVKGVVHIAKRDGDNNPETLPTVYIALVWDKQANGAILASENVFKNQANVTYLCSSPMRNLEYTKRFVVLQSTVLTMPQPTGVGGAADQDTYGIYVPWSFNKKFNIPCNFTNTTSDIANIMDNSLSIVTYVSDTTMAPQISYNARLRFVG